MSPKIKAAAAELVLAALLIGYGAFSVNNLGLLLLLASQSLWMRELSWVDLGLGRKGISGRAVLAAVVAAAAVLISVRTVIAPVAVWVTAQPIELSGLVTPGDRPALLIRLAQAWTLAAFGEEMVFRGYLIRRTAELLGHTAFGWAIAVGTSSALFGLAHRYQGWGGVAATSMIGAMLGLAYLLGRKNLWVVIICHGIVDTVALMALYLGRGSLLWPG